MDQFGKNQKIVIVEDNLALSEIYQVRLQALGYNVMVAYDGIAALNLIQKEIPDLVLMDLMVPKIAGDQILETMRKSDWGRDIPVYIISNLNEADAPAGLREMGIEGYAVKANLSNDELDKLVDSVLTPAAQKQEGTSLESKPDQVEIDAVADPLPAATQPAVLNVQTPPPPPTPETTPPPVISMPPTTLTAPHATEIHDKPEQTTTTQTAPAQPAQPEQAAPAITPAPTTTTIPVS